ncbi:MAG TPA: alpha/beta fold hydrolase [Thermomicrobiaceae bacterium]|nr:alpha/beta fold hydrolase [Thermomicrobiaceae bacterium]
MYASIDGLRLYYDVAGEGPVIALTHGIGGSADDFAPIVQALARRFRVLTYDARGHARSDRPDSGYTISTFARDLAGLLDVLDIERAVIAGSSMGGTITQRFILDYPDRALAAVIMSTSSEVNEQGRQRWEAQADEIERAGFAAYVRHSRAPGVDDAYLREHPELLAAEERRIRNNPDGHVYAQVARAVSSYNYTQELEGVRLPTLVLVGAEDRMTPPGGSVIISRRIPGAELHILPGLGHGLAREAPEQVAGLIVDFVERALVSDNT